MTFAEALRRVRTARKLTQAALAVRARLSRTQLVRIEGGLKPGSLAYQRLVSALGYRIGEELFAAAGDAEAIEHLAGCAQSEGKAKRLAAAPGRPEKSIATDRPRTSKGRDAVGDAAETTPVEPLRRWLLA